MKAMEKIFNLQLFADGAAEGAAADGAGLTNNRSEVNTGEGSDDAAMKNSLDAGDKKTSDISTSSDTLDMRRAEYDKLIKGEFKDIHNEHIQNIFNKRFKDYKTNEEALNRQKPIMDALYQKYGVRNGDMDGLLKAFDGDNSNWEEAAEREGMGVEQYRELTRLRQENEQLIRYREAQDAENYVNNQLNEWFRQGEELKVQYPDFDMRSELQNPDFVGLLKSNIPVKMAYELMHRNEINDKIKAETERTVIESIQKRAERPSENGINNRSGFTVEKDVKSLTKADRAEIVKRVQRGETIRF